MTTAAQKIKAKRARRPIYGVVERVAVLSTGEERLAILASHPIDRRLMKERGYRAGDQVRLEVKKPRNQAFHRLLHAIGGLMVDNVEAFRDLDSHEAIKRLQTESGVCCETQMVDMGTIKFGDIAVPVGMVPVKVPKSIAFDELDASEFEHLFNGLTQHIGEHYAHVMLEEVRAEFWLMVNGDGS